MPKRIVLLVVGVLALATSVHARPHEPSNGEVLLSLGDPAGDDYGPGTYVVPSAPGFGKGTFDLRQVELVRRPGGAQVRVTFSKAPRVIPVRPRPDSPPVWTFLPVVDVYIAPKEADRALDHRRFLPGRRVRPREGIAWRWGLVLSGVPWHLEAILHAQAPRRARDVCFLRGPRVVGKVISAFVPERCLPPEDQWRAGVSVAVLVTALGPLGGFSQEAGEVSGGVRRVQEVVGRCDSWEDGLSASPCAIGGCLPCGNHPYVLDILLPRPGRQEQVLRGYTRRQLACVPFVGTDGKEARPNVVPRHTRGERGGKIPKGEQVIGRHGRKFTIRVPRGVDPSLLRPGGVGAIVCPDGRPGGVAVILDRVGDFLLMERPAGSGRVCDGAVVTF